MTGDKKTLVRKRFFSQRKQLGAAERQRQSETICQVILDWYHGLAPSERPSAKVAMTVAFGTEPDTDPVMHALHEDGVQVWVPVSHADRSMSWVRWTPDVAMEQSSLGPIQEPVGTRFGVSAVADADVILVPALAVDSAGYRLGKGLQRNIPYRCKCVSIGLLTNDFLLRHIPQQIGTISLICVPGDIPDLLLNLHKRCISVAFQFKFKRIVYNRELLPLGFHLIW